MTVRPFRRAAASRAAVARTISIGACIATLAVASQPVRAQDPGVPDYELTLVALDGSKEIVGRLPGTVFAPRISPDGKRIAYDLNDLSHAPDAYMATIWIAKLDDLDDRYALPQIDSTDNWAPVWTPDAGRIVFISSSERGDRIFWQRSDGSGGGGHLLDARAAESWMPGGRRMTYLTLTRNGDDDYGDYGIRLLDVETRTTTGLIDLPGSAQHSSAVSPDGRWLAYVSNETGRLEVWVEPLPPNGERHRLTRRGGEHPLWSPDGKTLYFDRDHRLYRVDIDVDVDDGFEAGGPARLPITGFEQGEYRRQYDLTPDGRRFLMMFPVPDDSARAR